MPITGCPRNERGLTLIEVLVALLILGIGLLGVAGLELSGLKYSDSAASRSQAVYVVSALVDLMRTNPAAVSGATVTFNSSTSLTTPSPDCDVAPCNASQLATYDIYNWWQDTKTRLDSPTVTIANDGANLLTINLNWNDRVVGSAGNAINQSYSIKVQL
jgi:type IV pilus assembly protein PilV